MTPTETSSKRLSGGARGLLKDLTLLNEKTTLEMARGIAESYLDREGAIALAETLGVEPPRVKRRFYRYFVVAQVHSMAIEAYSEEEADREAQRLHDINVAHGDIHYGTRSRFNTDHGSIRRAHSNVTSTRPRAEDLPNLHRWDVERVEAEAGLRQARSHTNDINWNTVVGT